MDSADKINFFKKTIPEKNILKPNSDINEVQNSFELQTELSGNIENSDIADFSATQTNDTTTESLTNAKGEKITREYNLKNKEVTETIEDNNGNITIRIYDNPNNKKHYHYSEFNESYYPYIKNETVKYNDGYIINKSFDNGKLKNTKVSLQVGNEKLCIEFNKITEKELNIIKKRDLILQKDINNKTFSSSQILQMTKLSNSQWEKVKKRKILETVDSNTKELSFYFLEELSNISEKDWKNVEKRLLLNFKRADGTKLFVNEIKELAKISKEQWENILSRHILNLKDENGDYFFINKSIMLSSLNHQEWENVEKRNILTLKYPDGARLHNNEIKILAAMSKEEFENIEKRNLFNIKDGNGYKFYIEEIKVLAELNEKEWRNMDRRKLLEDRSNFRYIKVFSSLDNEKWETVKKSQLIDLNRGYGKYFSESEVKLLCSLDKKCWENIDNRNLLKQDRLSIKDIFAAAKLNETDYNLLKTELDKRENAAVPFFFIYEKIKKQTPKIGIASIKGKEETTYSSALCSLNGEKYKNINNELYGEKSKETENLFNEFQKKYPDVILTADNDITEQEAKNLIQATEEFLNLQKKGNSPFAKEICFTKLDGIGGFYSHKSNKIFVNLLPSDMYNELDKDTFLEVLIHENGHHKDYMDKKFKDIPIPNEIKVILKKVLREYAMENSSESLAVLTEAIEMPGDGDRNPLTKDIRLRKDEKGNYILMVSKNSDLTEEEVNRIGIYFRSIGCPELIPDYDENKHGKTDEYYSTIIRKNKKFLFWK